jgi:hypothetical protein
MPWQDVLHSESQNADNCLFVSFLGILELAPRSTIEDELDDTLFIGVALRRFEYVLALLVVCDKPDGSRLNKYNNALCQACRPKENLLARRRVFPRHYLGLKKETLDSLQQPHDVYYQKVLVHLLVQYGVPLEVKLSKSSLYSPLYLAAFTDRPALAEVLLQNHHSNPLFQTYEGETALSTGVNRSNYDIVKLFAALPSDVWKSLLWTRNFLGEYPIHHAAAGGHPKIIRLLLECEQPIREKQFLGQNVLHLSANIADKRGFELLFDHIHKSSPDQLKEMLNERDKDGGKSPSLACRQAKEATCKRITDHALVP